MHPSHRPRSSALVRLAFLATAAAASPAVGAGCGAGAAAHRSEPGRPAPGPTSGYVPRSAAPGSPHAHQPLADGFSAPQTRTARAAAGVLRRYFRALREGDLDAARACVVAPADPEVRARLDDHLTAAAYWLAHGDLTVDLLDTHVQGNWATTATRQQIWPPAPGSAPARDASLDKPLRTAHRDLLLHHPGGHDGWKYVPSCVWDDPVVKGTVKSMT